MKVKCTGNAEILRKFSSVYGVDVFATWIRFSTHKLPLVIHPSFLSIMGNIAMMQLFYTNIAVPKFLSYRLLWWNTWSSFGSMRSEPMGCQFPDDIHFCNETSGLYFDQMSFNILLYCYVYWLRRKWRRKLAKLIFVVKFLISSGCNCECCDPWFLTNTIIA